MSMMNQSRETDNVSLLSSIVLLAPSLSLGSSDPYKDQILLRKEKGISDTSPKAEYPKLIPMKTKIQTMNQMTTQQEMTMTTMMQTELPTPVLLLVPTTMMMLPTEQQMVKSMTVLPQSTIQPPTP